MAVLVEHDKRRHEILSRALDLFMEEGYEDVTFQKIADRCGITRTTLYIYFKNKREIFVWSIKQLTGGLEERIRAIIGDGGLGAAERLRRMCSVIIDECEQNGRLLQVLLQYLVQLRKGGGDPEERVARRVLRLQHLLSAVIIGGQRSGEFRQLPVRNVDALFYSLMESVIFRISVLGHDAVPQSRELVDFVIDSLCREGGGVVKEDAAV